MTTKPTPLAAYEAAAENILAEFAESSRQDPDGDGAYFIDPTPQQALTALVAAAQQYARAVGKEAIGPDDEIYPYDPKLPSLSWNNEAKRHDNYLRAAQLARLERVVGGGE